MFQRILVPLDGSTRAERAIPVAARIAKSTGGSIVLTRIVTTPIDLAYYSMEPAIRSTDRIIQHDIDQAKEYLKNIAQSRNLAGIETKIEVFPGEPALTIFAVARAQHADMIVMCSRGETGLQRWLLGSVTQKVARQSTIPVLVLREESTFAPLEGQPLRVMVPLDGSSLAEAALAPAVALSAALSAPAAGALHLFAVFASSKEDEKAILALHPELAPPVTGVSRIPVEPQDVQPNEMIAAMREQAELKAKAYLKTVEQQLRIGENEPVKNLRVTTASSVVQETDIASTLIRVAENGEDRGEGEEIGKCDMIAMATHGRGGLGRWLIGSVTERVLGATKLPLLIVRPVKTEVHHEEAKETEMQSYVGLL